MAVAPATNAAIRMAYSALEAFARCLFRMCVLCVLTVVYVCLCYLYI